MATASPPVEVVSPTPKSALNRSDLTAYFKQYVYSRRGVEGTKPRKGTKTGLRIVSYNIHFHQPYSQRGADEGLRNIKRAIDEELDADVICLQECVRPADACSLPYVHFHDLGFIGNAICSRFPLVGCVSYNYKNQEGDRRGVCAASVEHPVMGRVRVYNTHLDAFDDTDELRFQQASEVERIIEEDRRLFKCRDVPALFMGDFNALHRASYPEEAHWAWIVRQDKSRSVESRTLAMDAILKPSGWFDLFAASPPTVTTWSMRRIDYILGRQDQDLAIRFTWTPWVHYTTASDHLPVGVDLEFHGSIERGSG